MELVGQTPVHNGLLELPVSNEDKLPDIGSLNIAVDVVPLPHSQPLQPQDEPVGLGPELQLFGPLGAPALCNKLADLIKAKASLAEIVSEIDDDANADEISIVERARLIRLSQVGNVHEIILYLKDKFQMTNIYLGVQYGPFDKFDVDLVVYQEPLNTTGDMYHLLGFLALSRALKYSVPKIVLTYEENASHSTSQPYKRSMGLLTALKLTGDVDTTINNNLQQGSRASSGSRRKATRESIVNAKAEGCTIMDQKVTTQILADQCLQSGRNAVCEKIRTELARRMDEFVLTLPGDAKNVFKKFSPSLEELSNVIVLHRRVTKEIPGKNQVQDIKDCEADAITTLLVQKGYKVLTVVSSDMTLLKGAKNYAYQPFHSAHRVSVSAFAPPLPDWAAHLTDDDGKVDMGKMLHLTLFLNCYSVVGSVKVIGNTSGTTDIIALLGHNVLNIHTFASTMNYLSYRIVVQSSFLTLCNRSDHIDFIVEWCSKGTLPKLGIGIDRPDTFASIAYTEHDELDRDFVSLCAVEWVCGNEKNKFEQLFSTEKVFADIVHSSTTHYVLW